MIIKILIKPNIACLYSHVKLAGEIAQELGTFPVCTRSFILCPEKPYAAKTLAIGVGEMAQWLRGVADLLEDTRLFPRTHVR